MPTVWTIGHSNREMSDVLALLAAEKIESLADVHRFLCSWRFSHFNRDALQVRCGTPVIYPAVIDPAFPSYGDYPLSINAS